MKMASKCLSYLVGFFLLSRISLFQSHFEEMIVQIKSSFIATRAVVLILNTQSTRFASSSTRICDHLLLTGSWKFCRGCARTLRNAVLLSFLLAVNSFYAHGKIKIQMGRSSKSVLHRLLVSQLILKSKVGSFESQKYLPLSPSPSTFPSLAAVLIIVFHLLIINFKKLLIKLFINFIILI